MSGPGDLARWVRLWGSLDDDERRARAGRVTDRLLRRSRLVRGLGLRPATPSFASFAAALDVPLETLVARLAPAGQADDAPPPAPSIDWHLDPKSGLRWDPGEYFTDVTTVRLDGSDVRVVWEPARLQSLVPMGRERSRDAAALALSFIAGNPPGLGVNWASPMEVALRAVSLAEALDYYRGCPGWGPATVRELARALWVHGAHVRRNLEVPEDAPATNHYLANLLGLLAIARALPELRCARAWRELARGELISGMQNQVGADGVSFERSLPYHRFVTELFACAARLTDMPHEYQGRLDAMRELLAWSTRPDGSIPAWGDGDDGRIPGPEPPAHAPWSAVCGRRFESSGWHVMRSAAAHVAVATGPVGTQGLGNHTHNDLFAPSYWAVGRAWVVDPGTGSYARDPALRNRLRGVAAHAALQLGDRESNELPPGRDGLFRVIENAHPEVVFWESTPDRASLTARHTGYGGPEGAWTWERTIVFDAASGLVSGRDRLEAAGATDVGAAPRDVWLRFPLAPGLGARVEGSRAVVTDGADRTLHVAMKLPMGSTVDVAPAEFSPAYDVVVPSTAIVARIPVARVVEARWSMLAERDAS